MMLQKEIKLWDIYMVLNDLFLLCNELRMGNVCRKIVIVEYGLQRCISVLNRSR